MGADDAEPEADAAAGSDGSGPSRTPEDAGSDGSASAGAPAAADPDCVGDSTEDADALPRPHDPLT
ncbi:hypothetical protein PM031_16925, partial [Halorubrum ezzemoulense]|nr:hypothetical protein [Halorubrum ezzemoulense]